MSAKRGNDMAETIDVAAEVIESELSPLSRAEQWLATARGRVAELAAQYRVPETIADERAYKDAKASRASVRKDAAELDAERKAMTRAMDDALKRFRGDVKGVLEPLTDLDAAYRAALDEYEARWGAERRATLQEAYDEYAPDLVPLVPLDRLVARYGSERGKGWLNRSTNIEAAKAGLRGAVDSIAAGEQTIEGAVGPEDLEAAKADYFSTLDLGQAIAGAQARAEQRERVRRLEEERRRREEEYERMRAEAERRERAEAERREREEAERREREEAEEGWRIPYEPPAIIGRPAPEPPGIAEQVAIATNAPAPGAVPEYVFCGYGTAAQAEAFMAFCEREGISRRVKVPTRGRQYKLTAK